jgi:hypothetical protein
MLGKNYHKHWSYVSTVYATFPLGLLGDAMGDRAPPPARDGSALVSGSLREYERLEKPRMTTPSTEGSGNRGLHDSSPDQIGKAANIKPRRGGRVSDLIRAFDNPTTIYDPGADLEIASRQAMSTIGGGSEKGGSGEDPIRPKPSIDDNLALAETDR